MSEAGDEHIAGGRQKWAAVLESLRQECVSETAGEFGTGREVAEEIVNRAILELLATHDSIEDRSQKNARRLLDGRVAELVEERPRVALRIDLRRWLEKRQMLLQEIESLLQEGPAVAGAVRGLQEDLDSIDFVLESRGVENLKQAVRTEPKSSNCPSEYQPTRYYLEQLERNCGELIGLTNEFRSKKCQITVERAEEWAALTTLFALMMTVVFFNLRAALESAFWGYLVAVPFWAASVFFILRCWLYKSIAKGERRALHDKLATLGYAVASAGGTVAYRLLELRESWDGESKSTKPHSESDRPGNSSGIDEHAGK